MVSRIKKLRDIFNKIISTPEYQSGDDPYNRVALLHIFTLIIMLLSLLIFLAALFISANKLAFALQAACLFAVSLGVYYLNKKGRFTMATILFLLSLWIGATFTIVFSRGMNGPYIFLYVVFIALAGLLLGPKSVWFVTAFVIATGLAVVFLEEALKPLPVIYPALPLAVWVNSSILVIMVSIAIQLMQGKAAEGLERFQA